MFSHPSSLRGPLLVAVALACWAPSTFAASADLDRGLGVFTSPVAMTKTATLAPGASALVFIKTDNLPRFGTMIGAQFGVDVDPRLDVVDRYPSADNLLASQVAPDEWILGLQTCIGEPASPYTLMTYVVRIKPGVTDIENLRIDVRDLHVYGAPMLYSPCNQTSRLTRFTNAGGAVLNPSTPQVVHVSATNVVHVEGRPFEVAWEVVGSSSTLLNGDPVPATGSSPFDPTTDTTYEVVGSVVGIDHADQVDVEVIRRPRIDSFAAELFDTGGQILVRLAWESQGGLTFSIPGSSGPLYEIGSALVPLTNPPVWQLTATNEWGSTLAHASLPDAGENPPIILVFLGNPTIFAPGQDVNLQWSIYNADTASIDPTVGAVDPNGGNSLQYPTGTTTYTLTASNAYGTVTASTVVQLLPAGINSFTVNPQNVFAGHSTQLSWEVDGAVDLSISPDVGPVPGPIGSVTVTPPADNTTYTLTASNEEGSVQADVIVGWLPPSASLGVSNPAPFGTETINLNANVEGADTVTLEPGFGTIDPNGGVYQTQVSAPTTFVLTATNAKGSTVRQRVVTPKLPFATLTASNDTPEPDEPITLTATIQGASSATLEPGFGAIDPSGGTFPVSISEATTFVLTATSPVGSTVVELLVTPPPPEAVLVASTLTPFPGQIVTLTAAIAGAVSATLEPGIGTIDPSGGTFEVSVEETTTFTLTAVGASGGVAIVEVELVPRAPHATLAASDIFPYANETVSLTATVQGATSATLNPGFGSIDPSGGTFAVTVTTPTTYILTATNSVGTTSVQRIVTPQAPDVSSFRAAPPSILGGGSSELRWVSAGADEISIEPGGFTSTSPNGAWTVSPSTTTVYTLTATNVVGSVTKVAQVAVLPFSILSFTATPISVPNSGDPVTLEWIVVGAASVSIDGFGPQPLSGSLVVHPTISRNYTLRVTGGGETRTESLFVGVGLPGAGSIVLSYSDTAIETTTSQINPFVPFYVYVLAVDPPNGIKAFEFSLQYPSCLIAISRVIPYPGPINVGSLDNFIVGIGACIDAPALVPLVEMYFFMVDPLGSCLADGEITLHSATPSSFTPAGPGYLDCVSNLVRFNVGPALALADDGGLVSVLAMDLDTEAAEDGVELRWDIPAGIPAEELILLRGQDGPTEVVAQWRGAAIQPTGTWTDRTATAGQRYVYQAVARAGEDQFVSPEKSGSWTPRADRTRAHLLPNMPNPFNPQTTLRFVLAQPGDARIQILDVAGRQVWEQTQTNLTAGEHHVQWNGTDQSGRPVSTGVYLVQLTTREGSDTQRIALLK